MGYSINQENRKKNNRPSIRKALRAKKIQYKDLPPVVIITVGWDLPNGGGTHWEWAQWRGVPTNMFNWAGKLMDSCPADATPVILHSSMKSAKVTVREVLSMARQRGFRSVRFVDE